MNKIIIGIIIIYIQLVNANEYINLPCENYTKGEIKKWILTFQDNNTIHSGKLISLVKDINNSKILVEEIGVFFNKLNNQKEKKLHNIEYIKKMDGHYLIAESVTRKGLLNVSKPIQICGFIKKENIITATQRNLLGNISFQKKITYERLADENITVPMGTFLVSVFKKTDEDNWGIKNIYSKVKSISKIYISKVFGRIMIITTNIAYKNKISNIPMALPEKITVVTTSKLVSYTKIEE